MMLLMCAAAAVLMITMGMRQSLGLYIAPIIESTHVGYAAMSFELAVGQLMWGVAQPVFGGLADRYGSRPVLISGALLLAAGSALTPFAGNEFALLLTIGVLTAAGAGAGSFSVLIGVVAQRVPAAKRSFASGFVNAGGSLGQFVFAPLNQLLIVSFGWMAAMWTMAVAALATIPIAGPLLTRRSPETPHHQGISDHAQSALSMREQLVIASRDRSYWCLHAGFFTCGFHISFLVTHLPGEDLIKLATIATSPAGWPGR
jgi:MFS family permease